MQTNSNLTRDDFDGGPVSLDGIEPNLYLGNISAAVDLDTLRERGITHVLTLDTCPLPRNITELPHLTVKFVHLADQPKQDILSVLEDTNRFIEDALAANGIVLVHCYFGMSRSAAAVIAHVMKKHGLKYEEAFERVKEKRKFVLPNEGFVKQLKLYEEMGYRIDKNNLKYKQFRLTVAAEMVRKTKILPKCYTDLVKPDPGLASARPEPTMYRCKKCRRIVALHSNVIPHSSSVPPDGEEASSEVCVQIYFVEPLAWMKNITQTVQGKLHCPKCSSKLGSFSWVMGCKCPCGTKISPAFYLVPSKVEWSNVVQNIQMTV